jgi:hypothetical protein
MNYKKAKTITIPSQNVKPDPRSKTETLKAARNYIPTGDTVTVKGTKAFRAAKKPVKATWY